MDIETMERDLRKGMDIEEILDSVDWKGFEDFCAEVFERHSWTVKRNLRFKTSRRYEIDIVATKGRLAIAADCKHWGMRPGKVAGLRNAAKMQSERAEELPLSERDFGDKKVYPILITLFQEDITKEDGVWIVPAYRLNSFLLDFEGYLE